MVPVWLSDYWNYMKKKTVIKSSSGKKEDNEYRTTLEFDETIFKVITILTNYQLDLTKSNFYELIGFYN